MEYKAYPYTEILTPDLQIQLINDSIMRFSGQLDILESAIGAYHCGRFYGWRVLFMLHRPKTIKIYEDVLGVYFRDILPEYSIKTHKANVYKILCHLDDFWGIVRGSVKSPRDRYV